MSPLVVVLFAQVLVTASPYNAACDGTTNDTAAIQAAVNAEPHVVFPPGRTCRVNGVTGIRIPSDRTLTATGSTVAILPGCVPRCRALETIPGSSNIRIVGGTYPGDLSAVPSGGWRIGIRVDGSTNVVVQDATVTDWKFDGVWVGGSPASRNVRLSGITVTGSGRNHISIVNAIGGVIERCSLRNAAVPTYLGAGVDLEPSAGEVVNDYTLIGNESIGNVIGYYIHPGTGNPGSDVRLYQNLASGNTQYGVIMNSVTRGVLVGNTVSGSPIGMSIGSATEARRATVAVLFNVVSGGATGIRFAGVKDSTVEDNVITGGTMPSVALGATGNMIYQRNVIQ